MAAPRSAAVKGSPQASSGLNQWTLSRGHSEMRGTAGAYIQLSVSGPDEVRRA